MTDATNERVLLLAILFSAIEDVATVTHTSTRLKKDAVIWVDDWAEPDYKIPFTFPWVCSELDLDAHSMRERILYNQEFKKYFDGIRSRHISSFVRNLFRDLHCPGDTYTISLRQRRRGSA